MPAVLPNSGMRRVSGAEAEVFGFGSTFGGAGISFGGIIGFAGATMAGPVEQPLLIGAEPQPVSQPLEHEAECLNRAFRRSNKPSLLEPQPLPQVVKPVNSEWPTNGVPQAGAQATGAGAHGAATGAAQAGAQLVCLVQLNFALIREKRPMRGPHEVLQPVSHEAAGASQPPQPAALIATGAGAAGAAGAGSAPASQAELRIRNVAFTGETSESRMGQGHGEAVGNRSRSNRCFRDEKTCPFPSAGAGPESEDDCNKSPAFLGLPVRFRRVRGPRPMRRWRRSPGTSHDPRSACRPHPAIGIWSRTTTRPCAGWPPSPGCRR